MADGRPGDRDRHEDDLERRAGIHDRQLRRADAEHLDAQLLAQLAPRRVEVRLAGLALPTRELPQAAVPLVGRALAEEQSVTVRDDGGDHADGLGGHGRKLVRRHG